MAWLEKDRHGGGPWIAADECGNKVSRLEKSVHFTDTVGRAWNCCSKLEEEQKRSLNYVRMVVRARQDCLLSRDFSSPITFVVDNACTTIGRARDPACYRQTDLCIGTNFFMQIPPSRVLNSWNSTNKENIQETWTNLWFSRHNGHYILAPPRLIHYNQLSLTYEGRKITTTSVEPIEHTCDIWNN